MGDQTQPVSLPHLVPRYVAVDSSQQLCYPRHAAEGPLSARGLHLLRRLRGWFLLGALLVCIALFVGLIHDFGQPEVTVGWFTTHPALPLILLVIGYLCMLGQRLGSNREE